MKAAKEGEVYKAEELENGDTLQAIIGQKQIFII